MMQKILIKKSFGEAAQTYDSVAEVQNLSSQKLVSLIKSENISSVIDIGCGTGNTSLELYKKYPNAEYTFLDISEQMLNIAAEKFPKKTELICGDAENYEFQKNYDLAIANLSAQWFEDLPKFAEKIKTHCEIFAFSVLLNTSFDRYKSLFEIPPTFDYPSAENLSQQIHGIKSCEIKRYSLEFENLFAVARYFKKLGANLKSGNPSHLKKDLRDKRITLNYDVFFALI